MKTLSLFSCALVCDGLSLAGLAFADTLEMKDGRLLEGKYMGGTQTSIRFQAEGKVQVVSVKDILALTFSDAVSSTAQPTPPTKTPVAQRPGQVTIAQGAKIPVRLSDTVSVQYNRKDDWFAGTLEQDLLVNGTLVAPKGTPVNGQVVSASQQGKYGPSLVITLRELEVGSQTIKVATNNYIVQTQAVQNVRDLNDLGLATLKIVTGDRNAPLSIPSRTVLEFETSQPIEIRVAK